MTVEFNHILPHARSRWAAAREVASVLGPSEATSYGPMNSPPDRCRRVLRVGAWGVVGALSVAASGCASAGGSTDDQIRRTAQQFAEALRHQQGALACRLLTPAAASAVREQEGKPCAEAIVGLPLRVQRATEGTTVYIHSAKVDLGSSIMFLSPIGGRWRIYAAGCTAEQYPPYDCTVQAG